MKKTLIYGKNGILELNKKYLYLILDNNNSKEEHIIWFDEIEDVLYKKPTSNKNGFIVIYLITKSYITNRKKKYKLILDRIDEKSIESNKKIYLFIKTILDNKKIIIKEVIEEENEEEKEEIKQKETNEDIKENVINIKENNKPIETIIEGANQNNTIIESVKKEERIKENNIEIISTEENKKYDNNIAYEEEIIEDNNSIIELDDNNIDEIIEDDYDIIEEEHKEIIKSEDIEIKVEEKEEQKEEHKEDYRINQIESLKKKIEELEKKLQIITYKEIILNNHIDTSMDRKKIDNLIIELKKILDLLENIEKELLKHERIINENDFIRLQNGIVIITNINKMLLNSNSNVLENYIDTYKKTVNKLIEIEKKTDSLEENANYKKNSLQISDEEYEIDINRFRNVKTNKEFINDYLKETKNSLNKVKWKIEKSINPQVKYKFIRKEISKQTKRLAALTTLNSLRPKKSRFSMIALSLFTGTSAITDLFGYDIKKVEYNEIIEKHLLVGLETFDFDKIKILIGDSKDQLNKILYDCEKKYSDYPKFKEIKNSISKLKLDIENQEKELESIEKKEYDYELNSKVKILKYKQE